MLSCVRSVMNHRWHRNVLRKDGGTRIDSRSTLKSTSTVGPGRGGISYLTHFDETRPV